MDSQKKKEDEKKIMNIGNQKDFDQYQTTYPQLYAQEMQNNFIQNSQYIGDSSNNNYINPKQLYWIKKRKARREMLDSIMVQQSNNYMHESRHRHAMKRLRAPSGRFLTKQEMAEFKKNKSTEDYSENQ